MQIEDKREYLKTFGALYVFKLQDLAKVTVPTLVLNGVHESKTMFAHAEKMKSLIPDCEVDTVPDAGHVTNLENTKAFNERIASFFGEKHG